MIEPCQWLVEHAEEYGYSVEHCGPASVDLCLSPDYLIVNEQGSIKSNRAEETVVFYQGRFYICSTVEYIKVPETHCALINMRSSLARKGLGHKMAGFVDPGFEGNITLELEAACPVRVGVGERIVQMIYMRLTEPTLRPYSGKYKGQRGPTKAYN